MRLHLLTLQFRGDMVKFLLIFLVLFKTFFYHIKKKMFIFSKNNFLQFMIRIIRFSLQSVPINKGLQGRLQNRLWYPIVNKWEKCDQLFAFVKLMDTIPHISVNVDYWICENCWPRFENLLYNRYYCFKEVVIITYVSKIKSFWEILYQYDYSL